MFRKENQVDFEQLLAMLRNPGEDGLPETIYDDLSAAYTDGTSTANAAATQANDRVRELEAELLAAKAANWDLVQMLPVADSQENSNNDSDNSDDSENSDDIGDDDDFFEEKD